MKTWSNMAIHKKFPTQHKKNSPVSSPQPHDWRVLQDKVKSLALKDPIKSAKILSLWLKNQVKKKSA